MEMIRLGTINCLKWRDSLNLQRGILVKVTHKI